MVLKQFKLNIMILLLNEIYIIKGNNYCSDIGMHSNV